MLGVADAVELGSGPALKVGQAAVPRRQHTVADQQAAQVFDRTVCPGGVQGGVAAWNAAVGQVLQDRARCHAPAQPYHAALRAAHRHQPICQRLQAGRHPSAGSGEDIGDQAGKDAPPAALVFAGGDVAPAAAPESSRDAAAAGADRLPGGVQARQRRESTATGAGAGAQPGLQVAVLADPPLRPAIGAAGVTLATAHTRREPAGIGLTPTLAGHRRGYSGSRMRARSGRRSGLSSTTGPPGSSAVLRRVASSA